MTARTFEVDDLAPLDRTGSAVRTPDETLLTYELTVVAVDVAGVVASAGGWLCDRVRAGWHVSVLLPTDDPADLDLCALTILGVHAEPVTSTADALRRRHPASLALDARIVRADDRIRNEVLRTVDDARTEIIVWGESPLLTADARFSRVRHHLSAAARAFKAQAVLASGVAPGDPGAEDFVSAALWYPTDGADLVLLPDAGA